VNHYSYWEQSFTTMDEITYTDEQAAALKAADLETNRVPLYYTFGRLSSAAIQGLIKHGLVEAGPGPNRLELTDLGREEAQRLLAAEEVPGF
jgi:hypothetical protein